MFCQPLRRYWEHETAGEVDEVIDRSFRFQQEPGKSSSSLTVTSRDWWSTWCGLNLAGLVERKLRLLSSLLSANATSHETNDRVWCRPPSKSGCARTAIIMNSPMVRCGLSNERLPWFSSADHVGGLSVPVTPAGLAWLDTALGHTVARLWTPSSLNRMLSQRGIAHAC